MAFSRGPTSVRKRGAVPKSEKCQGLREAGSGGWADVSWELGHTWVPLLSGAELERPSSGGVLVLSFIVETQADFSSCFQ